MSQRGETGGWAAPFLSGRTVLVTGGTSGIGLGIAQAFAEAGANVIATGLNDTEVSAAEASVENQAHQGQLTFQQLDVSDGEAVARDVGEIDDLYALICCAGTIRRGEETNPEVFAQVVDVNLNGSMRCAQAALPALARNGGSVVMTASMLSFFGGGLVPGYSASKGGIMQLTKSLAIAWAEQGIRVNAIAPGWIRTPLTAALQDDPQRAEPILSRTPMGRWGTPHDLTGLTLFLTTPLAAFITGTIIPVDGGYAVS